MAIDIIQVFTQKVMRGDVSIVVAGVKNISLLLLPSLGKAFQRSQSNTLSFCLPFVAHPFFQLIKYVEFLDHNLTRLSP